VLAYAAALGIAPDAVHDIPVRPEGARTLWIRRGGGYEHVDVVYARRLPPGWGRPPSAVAVVGLAVLVAAVALFASTGDTALDVVAAVAALVGALTFALGFLDLIAKPVRHRGVVIARRVDVPRLGPWTDLAPRSRYVAIDEGSGRRIRAFRIFRNRFDQLAVGDDVELLATPRLGYVSKVTRFEEPCQTESTFDTMTPWATEANSANRNSARAPSPRPDPPRHRHPTRRLEVVRLPLGT